MGQIRVSNSYTVFYRPAPKLFRDLLVARADGSLGRMLETIARTDVLVVDDFAMAPLNEQERRDFLEICDDRYNRRSTILTSQLPVDKWHPQIGDPTVAETTAETPSFGSCPSEDRRLDALADPGMTLNMKLSGRRCDGI